MTSSDGNAPSLRAQGPLVVSTVNPRYFTVTSGPRSGEAVYLTGSHIWNNLHDGMGPGPACSPTLNDSTTAATSLSSCSTVTTSSGSGGGSSSSRRQRVAGFTSA